MKPTLKEDVIAALIRKVERDTGKMHGEVLTEAQAIEKYVDSDPDYLTYSKNNFERAIENGYHIDYANEQGFDVVDDFGRLHPGEEVTVS